MSDIIHASPEAIAAGQKFVDEHVNASVWFKVTSVRVLEGGSVTVVGENGREVANVPDEWVERIRGVVG